MSSNERTIIAVDPETGEHLRKASADETNAYETQPRPPLFRRPVKVGAVLIDEWNGPGLWFGGAVENS